MAHDASHFAGTDRIPSGLSSTTTAPSPVPGDSIRIGQILIKNSASEPTLTGLLQAATNTPDIGFDIGFNSTSDLNMNMETISIATLKAMNVALDWRPKEYSLIESALIESAMSPSVASNNDIGIDFSGYIYSDISTLEKVHPSPEDSFYDQDVGIGRSDFRHPQYNPIKIDLSPVVSAMNTLNNTSTTSAINKYFIKTWI